MPFPPAIQQVFDRLRRGRALFNARLMAQAGVLDACLPPIGAPVAQGHSLRQAWLGGLDSWHFLEGSLSPLLFLASRLWALQGAMARGESQGTTAAAADPDTSRRLLLEAFPALAGADATVRQVLAVVAGQGALDRLDARAWAAWPPALQQECLRLLKWRELQHDVPPGHAARCHAALSAVVPWRWPAPPPPSDANPAPLSDLRAPPFGPQLLAQSQPDITSPEWVLFGWSIRRALEPADTALACLAACLRLQGHGVNSQQLQAEWPIEKHGMTADGWRRACRRVGLQTREVSVTDLAAAHLPALCRLDDGNCLLVLAAAPEGYRVFAPVVHFPYRLIERHLLRAAEVSFACAMQGAGRTEFLARRPVRRLRFELLRGHDGQGAVADVRAQAALQAEAAAWPDRDRQPAPLVSIGLDELLAAHRTLASPGSPFHGVFRRINLHGSSEFLRWQEIPAAVAQWLHLARAAPASTDAEGEARTLAALFIDFLRIHPFLNGNRRLAMALTETLARQHGWHLDWAGLSRVQIYHAVRYAAAGHPGVLRAALARGLQPPIASVAGRPP